MIFTQVLLCSSRWMAVPSLLRPPLASNIVASCLRLAARRPVHSTTHYCISGRRGRVLAVPLALGRGMLPRRTLHFVRCHWKRGLTAGTLCGSGVMLGKMATEGGVGPANLDKCQSCTAQDDGTTYSVHVADQSTYCEATFSKFSLREKIYVILRCVYLTFLFCPAAILYSLSRLLRSAGIEGVAWSYMMSALQTAGPAFVKLGQWASTRRDIFSEEFCNSLSQLHTSCQSHRWQDTARTLREEFGREWEDVLEICDPQPVGSGCVAQVYKGHLKRARAVTSGIEQSRELGERDKRINSSFFSRLANKYLTKSPHECEKERDEEEMIPVAVKVLHPGTVQAMERDMLLMRYGVYWADWLNPDFHWVALKECFSEFALVMRKQLDMELEAHNLRRFQCLMGDNDCIKFPTPIFPYVTKRVLVETFEPGTHISSYMDNPGGKLQKTLARIGTDALLDMLFIHNFVHGDLHPGNILVQETQQPRLVLLDCGIATSLTQLDLMNMRAVFTAIIKKQGEYVADLMLGSQRCSTVEEYRRNMAELVTRGVNNLTQMQNTKVSCLFTDLFNVLMKHKVRIEPNYSSVVMAIMVIEGLGKSLDPSLNLLEVAKPCLLHRARRDLTAKIIGS